MFPRPGGKGRKEGRVLEGTKWKNNLQKWNSVDVDEPGEGGGVRTCTPFPSPLLEHIRRGNNNCDSLYGVLDE